MLQNKFLVIWRQLSCRFSYATFINQLFSEILLFRIFIFTVILSLKLKINEMGKYRVLRFEFPASSSPNFEFPASGKLRHLNRAEFSAYSSEFSASGKLGQLNLTEFSAYSSEFSAKGVLCILLNSTSQSYCDTQFSLGWRMFDRNGGTTVVQWSTNDSVGRKIVHWNVTNK